MEVIFAVGNIDKLIIKIRAGVKTCSFCLHLFFHLVESFMEGW